MCVNGESRKMAIIGLVFRKKIKKLFLFFIVFMLFPLCVQIFAESEVLKYQYQQTKILVDYVSRAANLFEIKGEGAFPEFAKKGSKWFREDKYLFILDFDGNNIFDSVNITLKGKNIIDMKDLHGKPIVKHMIDIVTENPQRPYGWVHSLWVDPGGIFPSWKSSYVMKVKAPSGKEYIIGSGINNMRIEKQFIVDTVDAAVELIKKKGINAFDILRHESSRFVYAGTYVFVLSMDGLAVVDPAFPSFDPYPKLGESRSLLDFKDAIGRDTVKEMIEKMKTKESSWIYYMWPRPGETKASKKIVYIRKVKINEETFIVGADLFLANPIWKKF
jgi:signal transduction histidine kinase